MASVVISGDSSGTITLSAPSVAGSNTATLPAQTGTLQMLGQGTAVATTSGTSVTFTGIPSWAKQITVMFQGVSTNGTNIPIIQIGSGSVTSTGYNATGAYVTNGASTSAVAQTTGFPLDGTSAAASAITGNAIITNMGSNLWVFSFSGQITGGGTACILGGGYITLSGILDRVVLTSVGGTDTFDAGSVNILYQG